MIRPQSINVCLPNWASLVQQIIEIFGQASVNNAGRIM